MYNIEIANTQHTQYAEKLCQLYKDSANERKTGIAQRKVEYIRDKIISGNAIIALMDEKLVGFCYIETWSHGKYVANSGLIVNPEFRNQGYAKSIKEKVFKLARDKYPNAKVFGITTSLAVMKINSDLGYKPVTFSELTQDEPFWDGCKSCPNYDILIRNERKLCLCTGMLASAKNEDPEFDLSTLITQNKNR